MSSSDNVHTTDQDLDGTNQPAHEGAPAGGHGGSERAPRRDRPWPALLSIFIAGLVLGGTIMATVGRSLLPATSTPSSPAAVPSSSAQASPPPLDCSALLADGKQAASLLNQAGTDVHNLNTTGLQHVLSSAQKLQKQLDKDLQTCQTSLTGG